MKEKEEKKKGKIWIIAFLIIVASVFVVVGCLVNYVDPFFHYHKPYTDEYYYTLDNERSQNYGIVKNFDYDALIVGTSMSENFKTSEFDELFDTTSVKATSFGATFKEMNDLVESAEKYNPNIKYVVKSLDLYNINADKDNIRTDMGTPPTYLYDDNILTDVKYIFNRDVLYNRAIPMIHNAEKGLVKPGIDSFDVYGNWTKDYPNYGLKYICPEGVTNPYHGAYQTLSETEKVRVLENVKQNITDVADANPDTTFLCFFPPYSVVWWKGYVNSGSVYKQIELEKLATEEMLKHPNIKVFHFNELYDVTTDLTNYKDNAHYGEWISSDLLKYMKEDKYLLTFENYEEKFNEELEFYVNFDYESLNSQASWSFND